MKRRLKWVPLGYAFVFSIPLGMLGTYIGAALGLGQPYSAWAGNKEVIVIAGSAAGVIFSLPWLVVLGFLIGRNALRSPRLHLIGCAACAVVPTTCLSYVLFRMARDSWW